jgi:uncharacterized membrane protein YesL
MQRVLRVTWLAIRSVYDELLRLAAIGFIWFVVALLLPFGALTLSTAITETPAVVLSVFLVAFIPAPPVTAALHHVAYQLVHERRFVFGDFWDGLKTYFWLSWKVAALLLVSGAILAFDVAFYLRSAQIVSRVLGALGLAGLLLWLLVQVYLFPLMVLQEDKSIKLMFANAARLALAFPVFSLGVLIVAVFATALSLFLLLVLTVTLWMPFVAVLCNRALASSLEEVERYRRIQAELEEKRKVGDE